jgi:hypothetical protein
MKPTGESYLQVIWTEGGKWNVPQMNTLSHSESIVLTREQPRE